MTETAQTEVIAALLSEVTKLRQEVEQLKATQTQLAPAAPAPTTQPALHRRRVLKRLFAGTVAAGIATMAVGTNLQTASANLNVPPPTFKVGAVILPPGGLPNLNVSPPNASVGLVVSSNTSVNLSNPTLPSKVTAVYASSIGGSYGAYGVYSYTTGGQAGYPSASVYSYLEGYGAGVYARGNGTFASGVEAHSDDYDAIIAAGAQYGLRTQGTLAPLRLIPSVSASVPATTGHNPGEFYVTSTGALYYFNGTIWKALA